LLHNNLIAFGVTLALSLIWLRFVGYAVIKGWISSTISRKVIHIGTGPLFVVCWLLFDEALSARYLAAIVPLISTLQFGLAGLGLIRDRASVESMSRTGKRTELLRGPFLYGLVFIAVTLLFWKSSTVGISALMILCGGDGLADIFGKRFGKSPLPWSKKKTYAGSLAMLVGGFSLSLFINWIFFVAGILPIDWIRFVPDLLIVSFVATLVESFSLSDIDNLTVPIAVIVTGIFLHL